MTSSDRDELIRAALDAQQRAFCPYSNFPVGAALRTASGTIYQGVNVENASYGLTICASAWPRRRRLPRETAISQRLPWPAAAA